MMNLDVRVVSLQRSITRRIEMQKKLTTIEIPFQFFDATDAQTFPGATLAELTAPDATQKIHGRKLGAAEVACADSHRRLYRDFIASSLPGVLILEDDVELSPRLLSVIHWISQYAFRWASSKLILYLGDRKGFEDCAIVFGRKSSLGYITGHSWSRVIRSEHAVQGTYAYYITRSAAISMLCREKKIIVTADAWDYRLRQRIIDELWVLLPPCVYHPMDLNGSLIETERDMLLRSRNRLIDRYPSLMPLSRFWRFLKKVTRRTIFYPVLRRIG